MPGYTNINHAKIIMITERKMKTLLYNPCINFDFKLNFSGICLGKLTLCRTNFNRFIRYISNTDNAKIKIENSKNPDWANQPNNVFSKGRYLRNSSDVLSSITIVPVIKVINALVALIF